MTSVKITEFIKIAACPACNAGITIPDESAPELLCLGCGRRFPIKEGIPVMMADTKLPGQD